MVRACVSLLSFMYQLFRNPIDGRRDGTVAGGFVDDEVGAELSHTGTAVDQPKGAVDGAGLESGAGGADPIEVTSVAANGGDASGCAQAVGGGTIPEARSDGVEGREAVGGGLEANADAVGAKALAAADSGTAPRDSVDAKEFTTGGAGPLEHAGGAGVELDGWGH